MTLRQRNGRLVRCLRCNLLWRWLVDARCPRCNADDYVAEHAD